MYTMAGFLQEGSRLVPCNRPLKSHMESPITPDLSWALLFPDFIILSSNMPFIEGSLAALQFPGSHWNFLRTSIMFNNVDLLVKGSLQFSPRRVFGRSSECSFWQTFNYMF